MPCYQVNKVSVEFKIAHRDLLDKALDALGMARDWNVAKTFCRLTNGIELNLRTGKADIRSDQQVYLNAIKRAYSQQAVKLAAKLNGWQLKTTNNLQGQLVKGSL